MVQSCRAVSSLLGFPQSLSCRLTNDSLVPVAFTLSVPGDGRAEPSVPSAVQVLDNSSPSWRKRVRRRLGRREFTISPCSGTIRALSFVDIQVGSSGPEGLQQQLELKLACSGRGLQCCWWSMRPGGSLQQHWAVGWAALGLAWRSSLWALQSEAAAPVSQAQAQKALLRL